MAVTGAPASILAWAERPGAAALLSTAREKVETGRSGNGSRLLVEKGHREDVGRMLGVSWELSGKGVTLKALRDALVSAGTTLEAVLVATGGPLRNAATEKAQAQEAFAAQRRRLVATLMHAGIPDPVAKMSLRWLGPAERAERTAEQVAGAWAALPVRPGSSQIAGRPVGLAVFAGQVLDDPHALDRGSAAGRALVRTIVAVTAAHEVPDKVPETVWSADQVGAAPAAAGAALSARDWRAAWALAGVQCDQVSSTVLVLNVPLTGPNPALEQVSAVAGEPMWLTARMTGAGCAATVPPQGTLLIRVCENPAVLEAAAAELGAACPPLVCLYGRPSSAAWDVLDAVVAAGGRLQISCDRDGAGNQILAGVTDAYPAGSVDEWLPTAVGLYEEQRLSELLADLSR